MLIIIRLTIMYVFHLLMKCVKTPSSEVWDTIKRQNIVTLKLGKRLYRPQKQIHHKVHINYALHYRCCTPNIIGALNYKGCLRSHAHKHGIAAA